jgi:hypothetical protein
MTGLMAIQSLLWRYEEGGGRGRWRKEDRGGRRGGGRILMEGGQRGTMLGGGRKEEGG